MPQSGPTSAYKLHTTNQSDRSTKEFLKQAKQFPSRTLINSKSLSRVHLHPPPPEGEHRLFRAQKSFGRYGIVGAISAPVGNGRKKRTFLHYLENYFSGVSGKALPGTITTARAVGERANLSDWRWPRRTGACTHGHICMQHVRARAFRVWPHRARYEEELFGRRHRSLFFRSSLITR